MIKEVHFSGTTFNNIPYKFEAGTPNIGEVVAFKKALDFVDEVGKENIAEYEQELLTYATELLKEVDGFKPVGVAEHKASVISFLIGQIHPYDVGTILDQLGIAVRTGHHCTQPLMDHLEIPGTVRASFAFYNNEADIDRLVEGLRKAAQMLG